MSLHRLRVVMVLFLILQQKQRWKIPESAEVLDFKQRNEKYLWGKHLRKKLLNPTLYCWNLRIILQTEIFYSLQVLKYFRAKKKSSNFFIVTLSLVPEHTFLEGYWFSIYQHIYSKINEVSSCPVVDRLKLPH